MVTTELVDVNSRARIWGDTFDRQQADVLAVQDEITGAIIRALNVRPDEGAERRLARVLTTDPAAYELYLQGVHHFRLQQEDDYLIARRLLTQAVEQDGEFALAYVTLASTYSVTAIDGYEAPRSAWPNQIAHIARAIQLDPDLPDAHAEATASAFYYQWDWSAAEREWQAALKSRRGEIQPELLFARALQQWALGRSAEALEFARAARLADPLSAALRLREADLLARTRQFDAAAAMYQKTIDDAPDDPRAFFGLAEVRRLQARFDEANQSPAPGS
jgi:tetratricopeptide (TPR) repeat protein